MSAFQEINKKKFEDRAFIEKVIVWFCEYDQNEYPVTRISIEAEKAAEELATLQRKANDVPEYEAEITRLRLRADKRTDEIIELQASLKDVESNYDALQTPMPCGHLARYMVNEKDGTQYCMECLVVSLTGVSDRKIQKEIAEIVHHE